MTATETATVVAAAAVADAGFTPCAFSGFVHNGAVFAFSEESANGFSESGPAFEVVVNIETGAVVR
jgi:hypothetical protein